MEEWNALAGTASIWVRLPVIRGDAYIIDGQSNAEATGPNNGPTEDPVSPTNDWIRSYGKEYEGTARGGLGNQDSILICAAGEGLRQNGKRSKGKAHSLLRLGEQGRRSEEGMVCSASENN